MEQHTSHMKKKKIEYYTLQLSRCFAKHEDDDYLSLILLDPHDLT